MSFHCLMTTIVFDEKLAVNRIVLLFVMSCFSPAAFKIFSFAFNSLSVVCLGVCVYPTWDLLRFRDWWINIFFKLGGFFDHYSFHYFFCSFLGLICILIYLLLCHRSLRLCTYSFKILNKFIMAAL